MPYEEIIACLEQKVVLMTKILDLTKQIEVRCRQPRIALDDFLDRRRTYMGRVDKCNHLISVLLADCSEDGRARLRKLMAGGAVGGETEEERKIEGLAAKSRMIAQRATAVDRDANEELRRRYNEVRKELNAVRRQGVDAMFYRDK